MTSTNIPALARTLRAAAIAAIAAGCSVDSRQTLGLTAPPPDEFLVVARKPLERPADMAALPAPRLGAPSRAEPNPTADAQAALAGTPSATASASAVAPAAATPAPSAAPPSPAEAALLGAAGATEADPAIREKLAQEAFVPQRRFGLDSLFGVPIVQDPADAARRVQPTAEAERLREEGLPAPVPPPAPPTP